MRLSLKKGFSLVGTRWDAIIFLLRTLFPRDTLNETGIVKDKPYSERLVLINQLDKEDKSTVFKIIDIMLTKKKFQDFFQKNLPQQNSQAV